ncbi:MAG: hypothetical protein V7L23_10140 [Nostoc sp.]|uniref:hypothetical protein n=1 Tax=Nostoc sp. TaxID=1180 RepID=UPI002FF4067C
MLKACACAGEQGSRGAGEQGSRGEFNVPCSFPSAPLPLCPSAFQTCEKCGLNSRTQIAMPSMNPPVIPSSCCKKPL